MAFSRKDYDNKTTEELRSILRTDFAGRYELSVDTVLLICTLIRERHPEKPNAWKAYGQFLNLYLNDTENNL